MDRETVGGAHELGYRERKTENTQGEMRCQMHAAKYQLY